MGDLDDYADSSESETSTDDSSSSSSSGGGPSSPPASDDSSSPAAASDDSSSGGSGNEVSDDSSGSSQVSDDSSSSSGGDDSVSTPALAVLPTLYAVIDIQPYDGAEQHPNSIQVSTDVSLTLSWTTTGASSVTVSGFGSGLEPNGKLSIPTAVASYILVAMSDAGIPSLPYPISVDTHDPDEVVSPHAFVFPEDEDEGGEDGEDDEDGSGDGEEDTPALGNSIDLEFKKQFVVSGDEGIAIGSYAKLAIKLGIVASGKFKMEGDVSPEITASVTGGFSGKLSANLDSGNLSMAGDPAFELGAEASLSAAEIVCKLTFETDWEFCKELEGEIKFTGFELETKDGKREVKLANVAVSLTGSAIYPPEESGGEVELGGVSGTLTAQIQLAIEATLSPDWGELGEKLGAILLEKFGELIAFTSLEIAGAPLAIIVEYDLMVLEICKTVFLEVMDYAGITAKVAEVNAAFAASYADAITGGDAPDSGDDVAAKAATQGHSSGVQARGTMLTQFRDRPDVSDWLKENFDNRDADSDDDEVEKQLDAQVEQVFNDKYTGLHDTIVSKALAAHLGASQQAVWNDFVGKYGNLNGDAIKLFGNWWMGGVTDEGALTVLCSRTSDDSRKVPKAQWLAIPAGMRARFCQLLNVSDPWSDDAPAPKAGPEASEQTVNKVWSWLQSHTQSSAADFPNYDDGETHLNSDQISTLNMKLSAQNAGQ